MRVNLKSIDEMSYTEFVAFVNQINVPPGSYSTLTKWRNNSCMNANSRILEVACTTGFSINSLVQESGAQGVGLDLCADSIASASENAKNMGVSSRVTFSAMDAVTYKPCQPFSHVVVGAGLGFFPAPEAMIETICACFGSSGYLLASPFFATESIPDALLHRAEKIFGITPTIASYKDVMQIYKGFEIYFEERHCPIPETETELHHYCESNVSRASSSVKGFDRCVRDAMYDRLYEIKKMSNALRSYQGYTVLVLHYESSRYPNRYVELF